MLLVGIALSSLLDFELVDSGFCRSDKTKIIAFQVESIGLAAKKRERYQNCRRRKLENVLLRL